MSDQEADGADAQLVQRFAAVLSRRYAVFTLAVVAFVSGLALLERTGWPRAWIGASFLIATVLVYAAVGLMCRTTDEREYFVAGRRVPAMFNGMATAADWMSAASFIGTAGMLYLHGFAGLAYIIGWTGGYCLVALFLAPYLRRFGGYTIPEFLEARYGGVWPRLVGVWATITVSFLYVVVQIYGVGLITSHLTGFSFEMGIFVGLGGVLVCSFLGGMRAVTWTQVAQYIVLIGAYLVPVVWLSIKQTAQPVPFVAYGDQLVKVTQREQGLIIDPREREVMDLLRLRAATADRKLEDLPAAMAQDVQQLNGQIDGLRGTDAPLSKVRALERRLAQLPKTVPEAKARYELERDKALSHAHPLAGMPPQALPYAAEPGGREGLRAAAQSVHGTGRGFEAARINFAALVFCLTVGTAALPHVLTRFYTTTTVRAARRSVMWSLIFIMLLYLAVPALAVMVKYEVLSNLVGTPYSQLPSWIHRWAKLGAGLVSVEDVNGDGVLQLAELTLSPDVIVLAAPEIGGMPFVVTYLVAAGGLAAALSTADSLLLTIANALANDTYYRYFSRSSSMVRRVTLSKVLVLVVALLAAFVASMRLADILQLVAAAFSLAASVMFPALVSGIFWRRANRFGAMAGMVAGLSVCLYYMATNVPLLRDWLGVMRPISDCRWWKIDPTSAGVFGVPLGFAGMVLGSWVGQRWLTASEKASTDALVQQLRTPLNDSTVGAARSGAA